MQRWKNADESRPPKPTGSWLAGMVIGSLIVTMATGAAMAGASVAIGKGGLGGGRRSP